MVDAFAAFAAQVPEASPRLYLIGGMNELGPDASDYHYKTGLALKLRPQDQVLLTGPYMSAFKEGLLAAGARLQQVQLVETVEEMRLPFEVFKGAIFLKGSKSFKLWQLLPDEWVGVV
jgi:UDP-N-acetylmuramyl pentapeptide synthase